MFSKDLHCRQCKIQVLLGKGLRHSGKKKKCRSPCCLSLPKHFSNFYYVHLPVCFHLQVLSIWTHRRFCHFSSRAKHITTGKYWYIMKFYPYQLYKGQTYGEKNAYYNHMENIVGKGMFWQLSVYHFLLFQLHFLSLYIQFPSFKSHLCFLQLGQFGHI